MADVAKRPRFIHAANRQIVRDTLAPRIAKAQVRKQCLTGARALAEIQVEIDTLLWVLSELNGTDAPDPPSHLEP